MTHAEFLAMVETVAAGRCCSADVSVIRHVSGDVSIGYTAYIEDVGHTARQSSPALAVAELREMLAGVVHDMAALGDLAKEIKS